MFEYISHYNEGYPFNNYIAYSKHKTFPVHWTSQIPTKYKSNVITTELYRAKSIATDFNMEIDKIKKKFQNIFYNKHVHNKGTKEKLTITRH